MVKLISAVMVCAALLGNAQDWRHADAATKRLAPSAFRGLPPSIRGELERRGCTIPQSFAARGAENVARGRFLSADETDWAVLCSVGRVSSILVFREGSAKPAAELGKRADAESLQAIDEHGTIGYSRVVSAAGPSRIRRHSAAATLSHLDHDGIDDAFIEKASSVWYWSGDRWLHLTGSN